MPTKLRIVLSLAILWGMPPLLQAQEKQPSQPENKPTAPQAQPSPTRALGRSTPLRNENRQVNRYDTEDSKERLAREGISPQLQDQPTAVRGGYAAELSGRGFLFTPPPEPKGFEGEIYWSHQNSIFNARNFFQVGEVEPSRFNQYGAQLTNVRAGGLKLTGGWEQLKSRGSVNGNLLAPLLDERTPRSGDPATDAKIRRYLDAFPLLAPNLPHVSPRSLNTNSPQDVGVSNWNLWISPARQQTTTYNFRYNFAQTDIDAFQLVGGQNPDTHLRNQDFRATLARQRDPSRVSNLGFAFQRQHTTLLATDRAVGPEVEFFKALTSLGPPNLFPIIRFRNRFAYDASQLRTVGRHELRWGGELSRVQINDLVQIVRGKFEFSSNFGRSAVENFLHGTPSKYRELVGNMYRGFREWSGNAYGMDRIQVRPGLLLTLGVRWEFLSRPTEVNDLNQLPFDGDFNNFAPRVGLALRRGSWVLRAGYGISYGTVFHGTYQQVRANAPHARIFEISNPDFLDPFSSLPPGELQSDRRGLRLLDPNLASPYSHLYSASLETSLPWGLTGKVGYVGSRTFKLFYDLYGNRARPLPGIPLTTRTVNDRRPDLDHFDIKTTYNMGIAYLDALQGSITGSRNNLSFRATYHFSKLLDTSTNVLYTGFGRSLKSQTEFDVNRDTKGPSDFDAPHGFELVYFYQLPAWKEASRWRAVFSGWAVLGTVLFKSGTPFTVLTGSDAPGFGNVDGEPDDRPFILDPSLLGKSFDDPNTSARLLTKQAFSTNLPPGGRGNLGRNAFRKDGTNNFNLAVVRRVDLPSGNGAHVQIRAEVFNLLNHAQFDAPGTNVVNDDFGLITNTLNNGRVLQLSLRLAF